MIEYTLTHLLAQHKRFVSYGTHPNPSLTLRTSFMLATLYEMVVSKKNKNKWRFR